MNNSSVMDTIRVRIAGVAPESVVDGSGLRCAVFFQGCRQACPGCHNPDTWDPEGGEELSLTELVGRLRLNPLLAGVTFSGGEPFLQAPAAAVLAGFLKGLGLNLWVYTGFTWEYLRSRQSEPGYQELLNLADILVDGPFRLAEKDPNLTFRGSSNQRLIRVPESLAAGTIVLWEPQRVVIR
ncbi:anaerobic ribonucleoside-triphosphate reductase activating protein [Hydrogenispora ethanolica]|jgi:anaerobic ribonucleoside-triphosphate reductase activating protein|uniref:Anaerobic ribonucleoside-triphosphate reductase-activating protein n=1 Tax=Hydrogenispora ethanolica TaxID=1082276 RepID=A0A4R1RVH1_HYDET|nr:anaerobic ribonucleoside-triphosphate reductase activating protein [Hydrogenispora ethanolica]TCL69942.1 anaerobic ribonucleoside-triphosphate reductase activating protein [Hydrogenispora ethanolica]